MVVFVGFDGPGYGHYCRIQHKDLRCYSFYAHLASVGVSVGQVLRAGDRLGIIGTTGNSTGEHLHVEIRLCDESGAYLPDTPQGNGRVDPETWAIMHGLKL